MSIEIRRNDILPYIYFVCSIAQKSANGMHGALSSKSDFIGGIFDRWINIIPESLIFNKLILEDVRQISKADTSLSVYSDFFHYNPKIVGIAPDVLGIKIDGKVIPFVKYDDTVSGKNFWVPQSGCPQIEVKSFKGKQYMVSLRNQSYNDKYLVMVEMNLDPDYLLPFFNSRLLNDIYTDLKMPSDFIISNNENYLEDTSTVSFDNSILGYIDLLSVTTASDFMNMSTKCLHGESPRYLRDVSERKVLIKGYVLDRPLSLYTTKKSGNIYVFNSEWNTIFQVQKVKTLDVILQNPENIFIVKVNKTSIVTYAKGNAQINEFTLIKGRQYSFSFDILNRSKDTEISELNDNGSEYFLNKFLLNSIPNKYDQLVNELSKVVEGEN